MSKKYVLYKILAKVSKETLRSRKQINEWLYPENFKNIRKTFKYYGKMVL